MYFNNNQYSSMNHNFLLLCIINVILGISNEKKWWNFNFFCFIFYWFIYKILIVLFLRHQSMYLFYVKFFFVFLKKAILLDNLIFLTNCYKYYKNIIIRWHLCVILKKLGFLSFFDIYFYSYGVYYNNIYVFILIFLYILFSWIYYYWD